MTLGAMILGIMTLGIVTLDKMKHNVLMLSIM
jgi:hypothetical protein